MKVILAIDMLSGCINLPRRYMYWEIKNDVHSAAVSNAMRRNRFINNNNNNNFYFANNDEIDINDKLRRYFHKLNKSFLENCAWSEFLDVNEPMCPYYVHHGAKMYIRANPYDSVSRIGV